MRGLSAVGRVAALGALIAAIALVAIILFGGGSDYTVRATFINGGQLVKGNPVQSGGVAIGSVQGIEITDNGQAEVTMTVQDDKAPLRVGTRARIRQFSQSGIANRYVDLDFPDNSSGADDRERRAPAGQLHHHAGRPRPAVQHPRPRDPRSRCRTSSRARPTSSRARARWPTRASSTSTRRSRPRGDCSASSTATRRCSSASWSTRRRLVTALAEKRDDLSGLVGNLNTTTRALANQKQALAESIALLPPVMRRSNTTFVNLRAALDDTDPLVDASKPVARRLGPFLDDARKLAADAEPTVADLRKTIRRRRPQQRPDRADQRPCRRWRSRRSTPAAAP